MLTLLTLYITYSNEYIILTPIVFLAYILLSYLKPKVKWDFLFGNFGALVLMFSGNWILAICLFIFVELLYMKTNELNPLD